MIRTPTLVSAALLAAAGAAALADTNLQVGNKDAVKGSFAPASEVENCFVTVPGGARLVMRAKGLGGKKAPAVRVELRNSADDLLATGTEGKVSSQIATTTTFADNYRFRVTSRDGATAGDYAFQAKWAPKRTFTLTGSTEKGDLFVPFSAEAGSKVTITARRTNGSSALPNIERIQSEGFSLDVGDDATPSAQDRVGPVALPDTADYEVRVHNDMFDAEVSVTISVTPPRVKARKIDVTSKKLGGNGSGANEFALAQFVGPDGGNVAVPGDTGLGGGAFDIAGSSVAIPTGALPVGGAIVVSTAKPLDPKGPNSPIGATVQFGPDGTKFAQPVTIQIPVDLGAVGGDRNAVTVYTRDAKGKVTAVPGPYDFDTNPGFVTFPSSHFSSYVAAGEGTGQTFGFATYLTGGFTDIADASAFGDPNRFLWATDSSNTVYDVVSNNGSGPFTTRAYAGGGTTTTYPVARLQADLQGTPTCVLEDQGTLYIGTAHRVFAVDLATENLDVVFGNGADADAGDGGPATSASIRSCADIYVNFDGELMIVDRVAGRVRTIDPSGNALTFAGNPSASLPGPDGQGAASTPLDRPSSIVQDAIGTYYISEANRIRAIDGTSFLVSTVAGSVTGATGCTTTSVSGSAARFTNIQSMAIGDSPTSPILYLTDDACHTIYLVEAFTGLTRPYLGTPATPGLSVDGQTAGPLSAPRSVFATTPAIFFIDAGNMRVRSFQDAP